MEDKSNGISECLADYVEGVLTLEAIQSKKITMTLKELLNFNSSINKTMNKLQELITKHYNLSFNGCNSEGQQKINELIKSNIIVEKIQ